MGSSTINTSIAGRPRSGNEPIQHAAVAGNQVAVILDAGLPLDDGEAKIAENAQQGTDKAVQQRNAVVDPEIAGEPGR